MADTTLSPTGLLQVEVGASEGTWGAKLNDNFDVLNDLLGRQFQGVQTYTPTLTGSTGAGSGMTFDPSYPTGNFLRLGPLLIGQIRFRLTGLGAGGSGQPRISLPFSAVSGGAAVTVGAWNGTTGLVAGDSITAVIAAGDNFISLRKQSANSNQPLDWTNLSATLDLQVTVVYFTA